MCNKFAHIVIICNSLFTMKVNKTDILIILCSIILALLPGSILICLNKIEIDWSKFAEEWAKTILTLTVIAFVGKVIELRVTRNIKLNKVHHTCKQIKFFIKNIDSYTNDKIKSGWNKLMREFEQHNCIDTDLTIMDSLIKDINRWHAKEKEQNLKKIKQTLNSTYDELKI